MVKKALDLFCCAGGASSGLARAGLDVTGVDINPQPRYPFRFIQGDVFALLEGGELCLDEYDFVWASPPCQGHTAYRRRPGHVRPVDTDGAIARIRKHLHACDAVYVIENVPGAPLKAPIMLCGSMFPETMAVRRHRIFEAPRISLPQLACQHDLQRGDFPQATNRKNRRKTAEIGVYRIPLETQQRAMGGLDWMRLEEISEAIPPAYSEWIARQWLAPQLVRGSLVTRHVLFKTGDADAPSAIKDRNGEVVLHLCRVCNQAEGELAPSCPGGIRRLSRHADLTDRVIAAVLETIDTSAAWDIAKRDPDALRRAVVAVLDDHRRRGCVEGGCELGYAMLAWNERNPVKR